MALANTAGLRLAGGQEAVDAANATGSLASSSAGSSASSSQGTSPAASAEQPAAIALGQTTGLLSNLKTIKKQGFGKTMGSLAQSYANKNFPTKAKAAKSETPPAPSPAPPTAPSALPANYAMANLPPAVEPVNDYPIQQQSQPAIDPNQMQQMQQMQMMQQMQTMQQSPAFNPLQMQQQMQEQMGQQVNPSINSGINPALNPGLNQQMLSSVSPAEAQALNFSSMAAMNPLHLYLTGVKTAKDSVQLKVTLRSDLPKEFKIPSSVKAILRTSGQADQSIKANFDSHSVSAGGSVGGTIVVPGKSLDPSADVILPVSALSKGVLPDLHLTVPISQRN